VARSSPSVDSSESDSSSESSEFSGSADEGEGRRDKISSKSFGDSAEEIGDCLRFFLRTCERLQQ
jgi:hypothetical protein